MARIDPHNRTGTGGVDLLSNNLNWSLGLVGLTGRGGLDLGLSLSYNSLVWTRSSNYIKYNLDDSTVAPGFRLDFPVIEGPFWNDQAYTNFYLMVTPSGGRVELRYTGTGNTYESADSAHLQLQVIDSGHIVVRPTDGSQMSFTIPTGTSVWRCDKITDRNGNFLTITHNGAGNSAGDLSAVTDTLGRTINVTYDGSGNIQTIDQSWNGQTHHWATFGWGQANIGNNFPAPLSNSGPNNTSIQVLTQVGLPDGSYYTFEYNNGYGQVTKIRYYGGDNRPLRYTTIAYSASGSDCPRVSEQHEWADWWSGMFTVPSEAVTYFGHDGDGGCRVTLPDGTVHKEYYGSTWQSGLTSETKDYATVADANADYDQNRTCQNNTWKKCTTTAWAQDSNVSYLANPRVTQTDIWDIEGNHRKTTISYGPYAQWSLPYLMQEYDPVSNTVIRNTYTDYLTDPNQSLDQQYLQKRIIGLVKARHVSDSWFRSKTTYDYDESGQTQSTGTTIQHDPAFGTSTLRGNVTSVTRWDTTDPNTINDGSKKLTSSIAYDTNGSPVSSSDASGHTSHISYTDAFSADGVNNTALSFATFAYPTTITDADGNRSTMKYHYDFGAVTRTDGPPPAGQYQGASQKMTYDSAGRLSRTDNLNNNAYLRWDYGSWVVTKSATIQDGAGESHTVTILDGFGRAVATGGDNPGSTGGSWAKFYFTDVMGRPSTGTNPEEINSGWVPSGDDSAGWVWSTPNVYDWKGRPRFTYNMDNTYQTAEYTGCGCAGGEVVTLTDEGTLVNGVQQYRRQKIYSDSIGRQWKTEVLNWDTSVYSTGVSVYNARDQVSTVLQYSGSAASDASSTNENASCPTGTCQKTTMTFDGYGRLASKHVPEQNTGTATNYSYNSDDTINSVTDARGASATYAYNNNRHLVNTITYSAPSGVATTPNVTFAYDPAGNRTSATQRDSQNNFIGSSSYVYDQLSRLTSETYQFADLSGGPYTLNYGYNLGGELTSLAIPFTSQSIGYSYDSTGRLSSMSASGFQASYTTPWPNFQTYTQSVTSFISSIEYRAWGATKSVTYGNTVTESTSYNSRLQPTSYTIGNVNYANTFTSMSWTYDYYADGRVSFAHDTTSNFWDRSYSYDHAGRLAEADTNRVARGQTWDSSHPDPYKQTWTYDVWNNLRRNGYNYDRWIPDVATYTNNRRSDTGYDANGNATMSSYLNTFDVFGANTHSLSTQQVGDGSTQFPNQPQVDITQNYDADGRPRTRTQIMRQNNYDPDTGDLFAIDQDTLTSHYIHSSVLGARVVELDQYGNPTVWVYAGGQRIATTTAVGNANTTFEHHNPVTSSWVTTHGHSGNRTAYAQERDPMNAEIPPMNPGNSNFAAQNWHQPLFIEGGDPSDLSGGCSQDGLATSCSQLAHNLDNGSAVGELSIGGTPIGTWDFTGHGKFGLDYLSGKYGSIRIGTWNEEPGKMGDTNTYAASGNVLDDNGNPITDVAYGNSSGYYTYSFVNAYALHNVWLHSIQPHRPLISDKDIARMRGILVAGLVGPCNELIQRTLDSIPGGVYSNDLLKVFDGIDDHRAFYDAANDPNYKAVASGGGSVEDWTAGVVVRNVSTVDFLTLAEELTHADAPSRIPRFPIPSIPHEVMARAAINAAGSLGIDLAGNRSQLGGGNTQLGDPRTREGDNRNSQLFRNTLWLGGCR
jgi:YD repeat-containing protein